MRASAGFRFGYLSSLSVRSQNAPACADLTNAGRCGSTTTTCGMLSEARVTLSFSVYSALGTQVTLIFLPMNFSMACCSSPVGSGAVPNSFDMNVIVFGSD